MSCPEKEKDPSGACPIPEYKRPDLPSRCTWKLNGEEKSPHHHETITERENILSDVLKYAGNTPMIKLNKIPLEYGLECELVAKCEFFNPGGSVKDRIGVRMIEEAERAGKLKPGDTVVEPTSGNTGIAVALACAVKGYKCIIVMPEKMSGEKALVLKALGAEIVRTPDDAEFDSAESHNSVAFQISCDREKCVLLDQYRNPGNPLSHYDITSEEILKQCDNKVDMIVMGCGTGATLAGVGRRFKEKCPDCVIVAVEPFGGGLTIEKDLNEKDCAGFEVEGIGYTYVPTVLDQSVVDKWVKVKDKDTFAMARKLIKEEGLLCGGSSGCAVFAAVKEAKKLKKGQRCVVVLADGVRNYMTKFLADEWMIEKEFLSADEGKNNTAWWWKIKVKDMNLDEPFVIPTTVSFEGAVKTLCTKGCSPLPVVDESGFFKGVVTTEKILEKLASGQDLTNATVSDIFSKKFIKETSESTLGRLSVLLGTQDFVLIVKSKEKTDKDEKQEERLTGIITKIDLINYISDEKNCKDKK